MTDDMEAKRMSGSAGAARISMVQKNAAEVREHLSCWTSYLKFRNTERSVTHTSQLMPLRENDAMEDGSVYLKNVLT